MDGKTALVTGASQGIGKAIAIALGRQGVRLLLAGRSAEKLEATAAKLDGNTTVKPDLVVADLSSSLGVDALISEVRQRASSLDILIHCAAQYRRAPWRDASPVSLAELFALNFFGPVQLTQQLLPLLEQSAGTIVFLNSSVVQSNGADVGEYAASKHALRAFADSLRAEVSPAGIRVLSVYPGRTATPMQADVCRKEGRDYRPDRLLQPADVAASILSCLTLPDSAEVTDLHLRPRHPG